MSKSKKVKALTMYQATRKEGDELDVLIYPTLDEADMFSEEPRIISPVFVLPADAASYDRMVEQMAKAIENDHHGLSYSACFGTEVWLCAARVSLAAIGITRPKEDKS